MIRIMFERAALLCAALVAVSAQPPSPFFSFSSGGPPSSSPFSSSSGPPHFSSSGGPPPFSSSGGPPPFSSGGPPSSQFGGPFSSSPYGGGGPSSSPFSSGGPSGRPGQGSRPPKTQKNPSGNKLFSWIGSTMSKLQGLGPKVHYYPPKSKPSSSGGPSLSSSSQNSPPYFSSGGPPRDSFHNSLFDGSGPSPFEGGSVSFASPSHSNSIDHPKVLYRNPSGPPPSYISRPGPPPSFLSSRPSFSSRPPPSYSSGGPPPSYSSGGPPPSFSSGGPPPSFSSGGPPPSFSSGGPPPFSSSPFSSSRPSFGGPSSGSFHPSQNTRNNLEVFPSQQVSYQSHTLSQNQPGYDEALESLQNLYGSQSSNKPSYYPSQQSQSYSNYEQQGSYSQNQPQVSKTAANNFGASFHSIEPVRVAPVYDVGQNFKPSSSDMSGAASSVHHKQQPSNIHDTPFATIVNDYAAHADAATAGSEQMLSALQGQDMATAASTNQAISGGQMMGQGAGANANPIFEVVADANAPTYDGHPVDLNKLISMIEPGAQIDTMPSFGDSDMGASEQHPMYAEAPSNLELESDAAMASGIMSGNKNNASEKSQIELNDLKVIFNNINEKLKSVASESRPTVVKLDGTRLNDEEVIKEHFDKEIILDDLQENKDQGFIIVGVHTDNDTGDQDEDGHLHGTNKNWTLINNFDSNKNNQNDNDDILAIVQQLRNSATSAIVDRLKNDSESLLVTPTPNIKNVSDSSDQVEKNRTTQQHPNHNYYPELSPKVTLEDSNEHDDDSETRSNTPVINPIVDSVRQSRLSDANVDSSGNSSLTQKSDNDDDYENDKNQSIEDNEDDDGYMFPDDMIISTDGDLAASGARNVKSVAIIVTPPPNYVKIRNKYKKAITPLSAMMSSTTPLPNNASNILPSVSSESININETFSESLREPNFNSNSSSESQQTRHTIDESSISADNSPPSNSSGINNDSILNVSTISSGIDSNRFSSTNNSTSNRMPIENSKQTRRYPVYRGKSNA